MIDKLIPRELNSDIDERQITEGIMPDATNVVYGEDGDNSDGILKNTTGNRSVPVTVGGVPLGGRASDVEDVFDIRCIGSVKDEVNNFIYWFAYSADGQSQEDSIIRQDLSDDSYSVLVQGSFLNFSENSLVKADIINGFFGQAQELQTILYFTDGINPPRKINVTRQLNTGYAGNADVIQLIKAPPLGICDASFETDTDFATNNFTDSGFQFATQYIYTDGEESAISPYSRLIIGRNTSFKNLAGDGVGIHPLVDNVVVISLNTETNAPDVSKIRLLAKLNNDGPMLAIDEFSIAEPKSVNVNQIERVLYDPSQNTYRFYNDTYYSAISATEVNKLYDNVPFTASTQTIVGNRLVLGDYTEGRPNNAELTVRGSDAEDGGNGFSVGNTPTPDSSQGIAGTNGSAPTFEVRYSPDGSGSGDMVVGDISNILINNDGGGSNKKRITVNFTEAFGAGATLPAGTTVNVNIAYRPEGDLRQESAGGGYKHNFLRSTTFGIKDANNNTKEINLRGQDIEFGEVLDYSEQTADPTRYATPSGGAVAQQNINVSFSTGQNSSIQEVLDRFRDEISSQEIRLRVHSFYSYTPDIYWGGSDTSYRWDIDPGENVPGFVDDAFVGWDVYFKFNTYDLGGGQVAIQPYVTQVRLKNYDSGSLGDYNYGLYTLDPVTGGADPNYDNFAEINGFAYGDPSAVFGSSWNWYNGATNDSDYSWQGGQTEWIDLSKSSVSAVAYGSSSGFKAGSWHNFGVVYYDDYGRSSFVQEIGKAYVPWYSERPGGYNDPSDKGPASIRINFQNYLPPRWATSYQVVYSGRSSIGDFTQYAVAKAYNLRKLREGDATGSSPYNASGFSDTDKRIYVSLKTLDRYQQDKATNRKYSFKEGDKLRILSSRHSNSGDKWWPVSSDGGIIEFDIVGVEYLDTAGINNPIDKHPPNTNGDEQYKGTFLVLAAPHIEGGVPEIDTGDPLVYNGYQWEYVRGGIIDGVEYPATEYGSKWGKETIVEIYSPKKRTENDVYYEIGHRFPISYEGATYTETFIRNQGFPNAETLNVNGYIGPNSTSQQVVMVNPHHITSSQGVDITNGDIIFRDVPVLAPTRDSATGFWSLYVGNYKGVDEGKWTYRPIALECDTVNEISSTKDWNRGRPHAVFPGAFTKREENGLTYSEAWEQSTSNLLFSSFNPTLANFDNLERGFGPIRYLGSLDSSNMYCLQENKMSLIPVNESIIQQADGNSIAALSTQFINSPRYMSEDFGCGNHPESITQGEGMVLFVDPSREKIVQYIGGQLVPISDKAIKSALRNEIELFNEDNGWRRIVTGINPEDTTAYFTVRRGPAGAPLGTTWGYDYARRSWMSKYSFLPDAYSHMDNKMFSFRYFDQAGREGFDYIGLPIWAHDGDTYNTFYGTSYDSAIELVSKVNPSLVKLFNAMSYEGNDGGWTAFLTTDSGQVVNALKSGSFEEIEGGYYSALERSSNGGTSHIIGIGQVASQNGNEITFKNKVSDINFPSNAVIRRINGTDLEDIGTDIVFDSTSGVRKITVSGTGLSVSEDDNLVAVGTSVLDGDPARGRYAVITMTNSSTNQIELFCVNAHVTESKHNHRMGQQQ